VWKIKKLEVVNQQSVYWSFVQNTLTFLYVHLPYQNIYLLTRWGWREVESERDFFPSTFSLSLEKRGKEGGRGRFGDPKWENMTAAVCRRFVSAIYWNLIVLSSRNLIGHVRVHCKTVIYCGAYWRPRQIHGHSRISETSSRSVPRTPNGSI
jgi:hypothetical protein